MSKLIALATGAVGYVLGARAGREQYTAIVEKANQLWSDPRVQQRKDQVAGAAKSTATQAKTRMSGDGDTTSTDTTPSSTTDEGTAAPRDTFNGDHTPDLTVVNPPRGAQG